MKENSPSVDQLNFARLFSELKKRLLLVVLVIMVCVSVALVYTKYFCTPLYTSCAKIFIFNSEAEKVSSSEFAISTYLTKDYSELILDRSVLEEANAELGFNYSYAELKSAIKVVNPEDSRILEVYATTSSQDRSQQIADKVCVVAQKKIVDFMGVDRVNIISEAYYPTSPTSPSLPTNLLFGALVGVGISALIVFLFYFKDDNLYGEEDVAKYLDVNILGVIPYSKTKDSRRAAK